MYLSVRHNRANKATVVTISAMANPSSIVALRPTELVVGHELRGGVLGALHVRNIVTGYAGTYVLDLHHPLLHKRAKPNDT